MAKSFPFESKNLGTNTSPDWDRAITAQDERDFNKLCWTNGVFSNPPDSLSVIAQSGTSIKIKPGGAHIEGARFWESSSRSITLSQASSTLSRIDRVVLRFDTAEDKRNIDIYLKEGVPATHPSPQEIIRQSNYYELVLADIYVPAGASEITNANITDQRYNPDLCGLVIPAIPFENQSEDLWKQLKDGVSLVESALDGSTAAKLKATIGNSAPIGGYNAPPSFKKMTEQITSYTSMPKTISDATDVLGGRVLDLKKQVDGLISKTTLLEKMISKLGIDWIIESSNINGWEVEKWHSGKMVQTLYKAKDNTGWTDIPYTAELIVSTKAYTFPQRFTNVPVVLASASGGSGIGIGVTTHPTSTNVNLHVTGSQSCMSTEARDISINAIGKWK